MIGAGILDEPQPAKTIAHASTPPIMATRAESR